MALSAKERKQLKALGQTRDDDVRVGKAAMSEGFLTHLRDELLRKELVKVRFAELEGGERKAFAEEMAAAAGAELVGVLGRTILLYRANEAMEKGKRVLGQGGGPTRDID